MLKRLNRVVWLGLALLAAPLWAELSVEERIEDFETFWESYKTAYVFFELKNKDYGVDWDAIKGDFVNRLKESTSDIELYAAITEAQTLLRDGHCYNGSFSKIRETERVYFQRIGLTIVDGKRIVVRKVVKDTEFEKQKIEVGFELVKFDGKTIRQMAKEARRRNAASSESQFWNMFASSLYIYSPLKGKPKSRSAELVFRDLDGNLINVDSPWNSADPTGPADTKTSWIGDEGGVKLDEAVVKEVSGPLPIEVRIFEKPNIGYVRIESWMKTEDPIEQFEDVFGAIEETDGMILDLRGNGGGVGPWGVLFTNYLIDKPSDGRGKQGWISKVVDWFQAENEEAGSEETGDEKVPNDSWFERKLSKVFFRMAFPQLGDEMVEKIFAEPELMKTVLKQAFGLEVSEEELKKHFKDGEFEPFFVNLELNDRLNQIKPYTKPVYVLTDGGCYSTTDICLTILHEMGRITIVGTPNGAGSGSPIPFVLPHSKLQVYVPHARAFPPMGTMIEGRPLQPQFVVTQTREDLLKGKDTVLTEAVRQLLAEFTPGDTFTEVEVDASDGVEVYSTLKEKEIDWGNIPMPDWAVQATLKHIERNQKMNK